MASAQKVLLNNTFDFFRTQFNNLIDDVNGGDLDNVDINGGTIDGVVIGGDTPANGFFDDLVVNGNLTVLGTTTTVNTETLTVEDPLIKLASGNSGNLVDIGFYGQYNEGSGIEYTGLFYDATDKTYKLFSDLSVEPGTTVNIAGAGYAAANLSVGILNVETKVTGIQTLSIVDPTDAVNKEYVDDAVAGASIDTETVQDIVGAMVDGNSEDGISVTYDDPNGKLDFVNTDKGSVAVATHEGLADPHPQYLTQTEADALYEALGGGGGANVVNEETSGTQADRYIAFVDGIGSDIKYDTGLLYNSDDNWLEATDLYANGIVYSDSFQAYASTPTVSMFTNNQIASNMTYNLFTGTVIAGTTKTINFVTNTQTGDGTTINLGYSNPASALDDDTRINLNSFFVSVPKTLRVNDVIATDYADPINLYSDAGTASQNIDVLFASGVVTTGFNKNIEIGTGGEAGSTTNIIIGSSLAPAAIEVNGVFDMQTNKIIDLGAPSNPNDAATKGYVDQEIANVSAGGASLPVTDDTATNANLYPIFTNQTTGSATSVNVSSTKLTFNPSTGQLNAVELNGTSDARFKTDISTSSGLSVITQLRGVEFTWADSDLRSSGVIAQEVRGVVPHVVRESPNGFSVNHSALSAYYIEAIKELKSEIDALKAEVQELKNK